MVRILLRAANDGAPEGLFRTCDTSRVKGQVGVPVTDPDTHVAPGDRFAWIAAAGFSACAQ
jgi:hypothetical protein